MSISCPFGFSWCIFVDKILLIVVLLDKQNKQTDVALSSDSFLWVTHMKLQFGLSDRLHYRIWIFLSVVANWIPLASLCGVTHTVSIIIYLWATTSDGPVHRTRNYSGGSSCRPDVSTRLKGKKWRFVDNWLLDWQAFTGTLLIAFLLFLLQLLFSIYLIHLTCLSEQAVTLMALALSEAWGSLWRHKLVPSDPPQLFPLPHSHPLPLLH